MLDTALMLIPFPRNRSFVGRDGILHALDEQLRHSHIAAIYAPDGSGKSALAIEYAYRFSERYPYILWLDASTRESLLADYDELSYSLNLSHSGKQQPAQATPDADQQDQSETMTLLDWLTTVPQYLLILDDLQDAALLEEIFPASLVGHILITTHDRTLALPQSVTWLELAHLDEQGRARLLLCSSDRARTQDQAAAAPDSACMELVHELCGHPLALTLAGMHIEASGSDFAHLLQDYQASVEEAATLHKRPDSFERKFIALVALIVRALQRRNARACEILEMCAFLAPIAIPTLLFTSSNATPGNDGDRQNALDCLFDSGLLTRSLSEDIVYIHPLLQQALRALLPMEQCRHHATRALHELFYLSPGAEDTPSWHLRLLVHIHHCVILSEFWTFTGEEVARILGWAAAALEKYNSLRSALFLRRKALEIWERVPSVKRVSLIALRQKQFLLAQRLEDNAEAESVLHRLITDYTALHGPNHPQTILQLIRLARIYLIPKRDEEAEACYKKALSLSRYGRHRFDQLVIAIQYELALFYVRIGDFSSAEYLLQEVYAALEQQLGPDNSETLKCALECAVACMMIHKWDDAEALLQKVCTSYELDSTTPLAEMLHVWHCLALTLVALGKWDAAIATYQRILDCIVEIHGRLHSDLLPYLTDLIHLYQAQEGKQAEKQRVMAWDQEIREEQLAHPKDVSPRALLDNFNALGSFYLVQGRFVEAEYLFMRSLLLCDHLQLNDPSLMALNLSALSLTQIGRGPERAQQATLFMQAALTCWEHVLGPDSAELAALRTQYHQWIDEHPAS